MAKRRVFERDKKLYNFRALKEFFDEIDAITSVPGHENLTATDFNKACMDMLNAILNHNLRVALNSFEQQRNNHPDLPSLAEEKIREIMIAYNNFYQPLADFFSDDSLAVLALKRVPAFYEDVNNRDQSLKIVWQDFGTKSMLPTRAGILGAVLENTIRTLNPNAHAPAISAGLLYMNGYDPIYKRRSQTDLFPPKKEKALSPDFLLPPDLAHRRVENDSLIITRKPKNAGPDQHTKAASANSKPKKHKGNGHAKIETLPIIGMEEMLADASKRLKIITVEEVVVDSEKKYLHEARSKVQKYDETPLIRCLQKLHAKAPKVLSDELHKLGLIVREISYWKEKLNLFLPAHNILAESLLNDETIGRCLKGIFVPTSKLHDSLKHVHWSAREKPIALTILSNNAFIDDAKKSDLLTLLENAPSDLLFEAAFSDVQVKAHSLRSSKPDLRKGISTVAKEMGGMNHARATITRAIQQNPKPIS